MLHLARLGVARLHGPLLEVTCWVTAARSVLLSGRFRLIRRLLVLMVGLNLYVLSASETSWNVPSCVPVLTWLTVRCSPLGKLLWTAELGYVPAPWFSVGRSAVGPWTAVGELLHMCGSSV